MLLSPGARMARWLYTLLYLPAFPFVLLYWLGRADSRRRLGDYLGRGAGRFREALRGRNPLWVHAVSVGETVAALPVLRRLQGDGHGVFLTTTIEDAQVTVERRGLELLGTSFLPLDVPFAARRLLRDLQPRAFLLSETDLWPNLLLELRGAGVPAYLINGRISRGLARSWRLGRVLGAPALRALRLAFVQTQEDGERLVAMGLPEDRVVVCGNTKWEIGEPPALPDESYELAERVMGLDRPVIVAGSTHAPEEVQLLEALVGCPGERPMLVLVPRKPARAAELMELATGWRRRVGLWSELAAIQADPAPYDVVVVDRMGLLSSLYSMAQVAYVGGGFSPAGGHNFLEAVWYGKPILGGPNWKNFEADVESFAAAGAFRRCADAGEVQEVLWELLDDLDAARDAGQAGRDLLDRGGRASELIAARIREDLPRAPSPYADRAALT